MRICTGIHGPAPLRPVCGPNAQWHISPQGLRKKPYRMPQRLFYRQTENASLIWTSSRSGCSPYQVFCTRPGFLMDLLVHEGIPSRLFQKPTYPSQQYILSAAPDCKSKSVNSICADHDGFVLPKFKGFLRVRNKSYVDQGSSPRPRSPRREESWPCANYIRRRTSTIEGKGAGDHTRCAARGAKGPALPSSLMIWSWILPRSFAATSLSVLDANGILRLKLEFKLGRIFNNAVT